MGREKRPSRSRDYRSGMIQAEQLWKFTSVNDYVIGDFMWTGIDYLGEAGWPNKNSSSGVIDLCGFPKDGYYFYQSQWTKKPMVHIFPHWNWAGYEGKVISVIVYSNCDTVELFLNGRSFGAKAWKIDLRWPVILGTWEHLTYINNKYLTPAFGGQFDPANYGKGHWLSHPANKG